jgi:S1-C subfamily serine protease
MTAAAPARPIGVWLLAAVVWIAAFLAGGALLALRNGTLHWPDAMNPGVADNLRRAIADRRAEIARAGCNPDGTAIAVTPPRLTPPVPGPTPTPGPTPGPTGDVPLARDVLVQHAEYGIVLVLTQTASGSGFFIAPNLIVTNRHVVQMQHDGRVLITSKSLGHVIPGQVIATTPEGQPGSPDFALIRVVPPQGAAPFALTATIGKLESVVVGGYPGLVIQHDEGLKRLINGDVNAAPDLNLNDGTVSAIEPSAQGVVQIVHSATVLKGNSGGPLIDRCARVVGINTFIAVDSSQSGRVNYALSAGDLAKFLRSNGINAALHETPCP